MTPADLAAICRAHGIVPSITGLVRERDLPALLGVALRTVRQWRYDGCGPTPVRVGGRHMYAVHELASYLTTEEETSINAQEVTESSIDAPEVDADTGAAPLERTA